MFKIMQNLWLDELRAHRRKSEPLHLTVDLAGEDGRDSMTQRLQIDEVRAALHALPDDQRVIIALVVLDGMSYRHAAATLGIPIGTVMSRLARGRVALATRLGSNEARLKVAKP